MHSGEALSTRCIQKQWSACKHVHSQVDKQYDGICMSELQVNLVMPTSGQSVSESHVMVYKLSDMPKCAGLCAGIHICNIA